MVEADLPLSTLRRMSGALESQGLWFPSEPVNEQGLSLTAAWLFRGKGTYHTSEEDLEWLVGLVANEEVWSARRYSHTFGEHFRNQLAENASGSGHVFWSPVLWASAPDSVLEALGPHSRHGKGSRETALRLVLGANKTELLPELFARGWSVRGPEAKAFSSIQSKAAWDFFLSQSGDPKMTVKKRQNDQEVDVPLWKALLESHSHHHRTAMAELHEVVEAWSKVLASDDLMQKQLNDYWKGLERGYNSADVQKAVRKHPQWPTLRNDKGQSPLFVALQRSIAAVEALGKMPKAIPALTAVDDQGWTLWHHLLARKDRNFHSPALYRLALEHVNPMPVAGLGLVASLFQNPPSSPQFYLPESTAFGEVLAPAKSTLTADVWWAGSEEQLETVARHWMGDEHYFGSKEINGRWSVSETCKSMAALVRAYPLPEDAPLLLRGAVAVNELVTHHQRFGDERYELFDRLIEQGCRIELSEKFKETFEKSLSEEALPRYKRLVLTSLQFSEAPTPSRARPRM